MTDRIYLDHAATTPLDPRVLDAMLPYLRDHWGNPSSLYAEAQEARKGLDAARRSIAEVLGCKPQELVFTSGGSESDNAALRGAAYAGRKQRGADHVITTAIEHHAVIHTTERLEQEGFRVTYLGVDGEGFIDLDELEESVSRQTAIISIMHVNNEVGTIEPIQEAVRVAKAKNPLTVFHTDAVQAVGALDVNVDALGVDMLSIGAHKFYGPKGVGALYVRQRTAWLPQQLGGSQEKNRRAGTENVAGIAGMAKAMELAYEEFAARNAHYHALRERLIAGIPERVPGAHLTGPIPRSAHPEPVEGRAETQHPSHLDSRASNSASFCFEGIEGEAILIALDLAAVAASSGSACTSGSLEPSHVLTAMGVPVELARGSLRLTVGTDNTMEQMEYVLETLPGIVERLRSLSPVWRGGLRTESGKTG